MIDQGLKFWRIIGAKYYLIKISINRAGSEYILESNSYSFENISLPYKMNFQIGLVVSVIVANITLMGYITTFTYQQIGIVLANCRYIFHIHI